MHKDILVLAKSRKNGGFCVAGLEVGRANENNRYLKRRWLRPVFNTGSHMSGALPFEHCRNFSVLDVIRVNLACPSPLPGQSENWQCLPSTIQRLYAFPEPGILHKIADGHGEIWHDTTTPRDDQISANTVRTNKIQDSLMLIKPQDLVFELELQNSVHGVRKRIYCSFAHNGKRYQRISVTDPVISRILRGRFPETVGKTLSLRPERGDDYWLTLSLSLCIGRASYHYIVAAAVIDNTGHLNRTYR